VTPGPGRRPLGNDTRATIVTAARELFTDLGYQGTSLRSIARRAGVDPRMISYFFGSKQELFVSVMQTPGADAPASIPEQGQSGAQLAAHVLRIQADPSARQVFIGLIRAAATEPSAAKALHDQILERILKLTGEALLEPRQLRASLIAAQVVGLFMARYIVRLEPLEEISDEALARDLAPIFDHLLAGPVDS